MPLTLSRTWLTPLVDDDGSGMTGSIIDKAKLTAIADAIDAVLAGIKLDELAAPTDVTTRNATTGQHGLLPKLPGTTTTYLRGDGTFAQPVLDELAAPTDITTRNATAAQHGLLPKLSGSATTFLRGDGTFASPAAGSDPQVQFNDGGALGGDAGLTYNKTTDALTVAGALALGGLLTLTAGQLKFPATQNPSADANTLDDYEEGTWTPTDNSGAALTFTGGTRAYIKIGQLVWCSGEIVYPSTASGANTEVIGLPFTSANLVGMGGVLTFHNVNANVFIYVNNSATAFRFYKGDASRWTNVELSGKTLNFFLIYKAAA